MEKICVNKNCVKRKEKKRKIFVFSANQEASSTRAYLTKQIYKQLHVSSRNVLQSVQISLQITSAFYKLSCNLQVS
jgi:hypothetical protein